MTHEDSSSISGLPFDDDSQPSADTGRNSTGDQASADGQTEAGLDVTRSMRGSDRTDDPLQTQGPNEAAVNQGGPNEGGPNELGPKERDPGKKRPPASPQDSSIRSFFHTNDLIGTFRIERVIGRGGMGVVYEAVEEELARRVALKVLPPGALLDDTQMRRFRNEAAAAAQLSHPNIVPVFSAGSACGVQYYAMQLIEGRNLAQVVGSIRERLSTQEKLQTPSAETEPATQGATELNPRLLPGRRKDRSSKSSEPWREVDFAATERPLKHPGSRAKWFQSIAAKCRDVALAIGYAHDCGIIHRDIKPSNLILDHHGKLWVTDFGLAQLLNNPIGTATGDIVGTYRYMSPEQASGRKYLIDHKTDIYSLGATLYELLALRPAFSGSSPAELLRKVAYDEPTPLRSINPHIPIELETIVNKSMSKNPQDRYMTAQEFADDLDRFCNDQPIAARPPNLGQRIRRWSSKHPTFVGMLGVAIAMTIVCLGTASTLLATQYRHEVALNKRISNSLRISEGARFSVLAGSERSRNPGLAVALALESLKYSPSLTATRELQAAIELNHELRHLEIRQSATQSLRVRRC